MDLDSLLIVLKEELTPKWYEFGLVVGVPQGLMDSYSDLFCKHKHVNFLNHILVPSQLGVEAYYVMGFFLLQY